MRRHTLPMLSAVMVAAVVVFAPDLAAQSRTRGLDKDTFMNMESVGSPAIAPDGSQVVFTRTWVDKLKDQSRSNVWVIDAAGTRLRELTRGNWRDTAPVWSPDGSKIAFLSDRDGTTQIHVAVGRDGRTGATHARGADARRTHLVARRPAACLHVIRAR